MPAKKVIQEKSNCCCGHRYGGGSGCTTYCLGIIGAAFYFFPHVTSFSDGLFAVGKCLVWPAMLVYQALTLLKF